MREIIARRGAPWRELLEVWRVLERLRPTEDIGIGGAGGGRFEEGAGR
jgi:hypothetical protein